MKRPILAAVALAFAAAPASASAATIQLSSGVIAYEAASGEINAVDMRGTVGGPFDLRMAFSEFSAPLAAGPGCESGMPVICGDPAQAFPVDVALGDRGDVARVNSFTGLLSLDAGSGNDDVLAGGIEATADGGSGNDTIHLAANGIVTGDGGSGRDRIAGGLGAAAARLDGGSGDDLVVPGGFQFNEAAGGSGDDVLVSLTGSTVELDGGSGADVLAVPSGGGSIALTGGSGRDTIFATVGGVEADAGSGDDTVVVQGDSSSAPDTVTCGSGRDVAWVDRGDAVARDCEVVRTSRAPSLARVAAAEAAAQDLLAHRPDPSGV